MCKDTTATKAAAITTRRIKARSSGNINCDGARKQGDGGERFVCRVLSFEQNLSDQDCAPMGSGEGVLDHELNLLSRPVPHVRVFHVSCIKFV